MDEFVESFDEGFPIERRGGWSLGDNGGDTPHLRPLLAAEVLAELGEAADAVEFRQQQVDRHARAQALRDVVETLA